MRLAALPVQAVDLVRLAGHSGAIEQALQWPQACISLPGIDPQPMVGAGDVATAPGNVQSARSPGGPAQRCGAGRRPLRRLRRAAAGCAREDPSKGPAPHCPVNRPLAVSPGAHGLLGGQPVLKLGGLLPRQGTGRCSVSLQRPATGALLGWHPCDCQNLWCSATNFLAYSLRCATVCVAPALTVKRP